jgi:hypothetical protein
LGTTLNGPPRALRRIRRRSNSMSAMQNMKCVVVG